MSVIEQVHRTLILCAFSCALAGCTAFAELAYDLILEDRKKACERMPETGAYRECVQRARKAEQQAEHRPKMTSEPGHPALKKPS